MPRKGTRQEAAPRRLALSDATREHDDDLERRERMISIFNAPCDELVPGSLPELILMALAWSHDVRVYASGGETTGTWCVWLEPLADVREGHDGRLTLANWRENWHAWLRVMGYDGGAGSEAQPS